MKKRRLSSRVGVFVSEICCVGVLLFLMLFLTGCVEEGMEAQTKDEHLTTNHFVRDVVNHPVFKGFGELMLPWEDNTWHFGTRLNQIGSLIPYHGHVNADRVVGALNHLIDEAMTGILIPAVFDFYYGDNIPDKPGANSGQEQWRDFIKRARRWRDAVNRRGGNVTLVHLPEIGIRSNTHFPMSDLNNREIADLMSKFLKGNGLD